MKVLVLAGTAEARALVDELDALPGTSVVVSLAGRTTDPAPHGGMRRVGGFGGAEGLARFVAEEAVDAVVDATHPFAERMSAHAAAAARTCGVPLLRLVRPPWTPVEGDRWTEVADLEAAAAVLRRLAPGCALLALGSQHLAAFEAVVGTRVVVRAVEPPDLSRFYDAVAEVGRGPFTVEAELDLLRRHDVAVVVARNSGGDDAKLVAARRLQLPIVLVRRPPAAGPSVADVETALRWVRALAG